MIEVRGDMCNGCRICVKVCPHLVLEMRDRKAVLSAEERCVECGACQLNCSEQAIIVTKGTGCLWVIVRDDILKLDTGPGRRDEW